MSKQWGVGIIGAGPGVVSLHVPAIARRDEFRIVHVSDGGSGRAAQPAAALSARASTGTDDLLADPEVDVVAICSPPDRHAAHVIAAAEAGKRAILCEKPLALTVREAAEAIEACRARGVALVIGTNHHHDPAWGRVGHHLRMRDAEVRAITLTVSLPPNARYHAVVSEPMQPVSSPARTAPDLADPRVAAGVVRQLILGLGIHDLPAIRDLAPQFERVVSARALPPLGFCLGFLASGIAVQVVAVMHPEGADALWRMSIVTSEDLVDVEFPPSFVHEGTALVRVRTPEGQEITHSPVGDDGYLEEWRALANALRGHVPVEYDEIHQDALYAIAVADAAAEVVRAA